MRPPGEIDQRGSLYNHRTIAAMLIATALYVLVAWIIFGKGNHWLGSKSYETLAINMLQGGGYSSDAVHPTAQRPPMYPLILMCTMGVSSNYWFAVTIALQSMATFTCLLLVFEITSRFWPDSAAAWLSTGLLMLHGPFMVEMIALRETVWFTLGLLALGLLLLRNTDSLADAMGVGLCIAVLYLLRPTGLLTGLVTVAFLVQAAWTKRNCKALVVALSIGVLFVMPWQVYTWRTFGAPGFFPSSLVGYNFCKGSLPETWEVYPWIDADIIDQRLRRLVAAIPIEDEHAVDAEYTKIAWTSIRNAPTGSARHTVVNALAFISPLPIPLGRGRLIESEKGVAIGKFQWDWRALPFTPLILLILIPGVLGVRELLGSAGAPRRFGIWLTALCFVFLVVHSLTFVKTRYRLPLDALLAIPAGGWLTSHCPLWLQNLTIKMTRPNSPPGQLDKILIES